MQLPDFSEYASAELLSVHEAAADQAFVELRPRGGFVDGYARAGQFCKMRIGEAEGIFAMFSAPGDDTARFLVRTNNAEGGEAADALVRLPAGTHVDMTLPAGGGFDLERARGKDLLFFATGTGVAPIRAAIEAVLKERDAYGAISLDHGLRSAEHLAIGDDLARWEAAGVDVRLVYSRLASDGSLTGTTVQDALHERRPDLANAAVVAVGQSAMLDSLLSEVVALGGSPDLFLKNI